MNDKILFWQTSDWFNYNLANSLQEHNFQLYSIIDTVNKPKKFFDGNLHFKKRKKIHSELQYFKTNHQNEQ